MFLRKSGLNIHVYSNRWFCNSCSKGLKSAYQEFNERHFEHMEILHDKIIVLWTLCFALLRIHNGLKIKGLINEMKTLIYMQSWNCAHSRLSINLSAAGKKCEICYSIFIKFWLPEF